MQLSQKITPFLWFDNKAEEAVAFYVSLFDDAKILSTTYHSEGGPVPAGSVMVVNFQLAGQEFAAINGGPEFNFTEAISFLVKCDNQAEVDALWAKLTADGGEPGPCGWLKDKYGLSWQIVPTLLFELMGDENQQKAQAVTQAMLQMGKLDSQQLQAAYDAA